MRDVLLRFTHTCCDSARHQITSSRAQAEEDKPHNNRNGEVGVELLSPVLSLPTASLQLALLLLDLRCLNRIPASLSVNLVKSIWEKELKSVGTSVDFISVGFFHAYNRSVTKEMFFMEAAAADVKYNGGGRGDCRPSRFGSASRNK